MEKEHDYIIDGFVFHNRRDAERAQKEYDGVRYLREKVDLDDPEKLVQIYNKTLEQGLFETPIGIRFLRDLQDSIREIPYIPDDMIAPIDAGRTVPEREDAEPKKPRKKSRREKKVDEVAEVARHVEYKGRFRASLVVNIILAIAVVAMMIIAASTNSTTILNYESQLIDKYEAWESELEEREAAIKEYEEKYGLDSFDATDR
ncbi:MAG: hypothetical protein K5840_04530 [Eubacterium sp.]|nr:hypothetical protein [Eubacterium sp.]